MALNINSLRREADGAMYVSPARICVTADGKLVSQDDPAAVRLLVGEGGSLPVAIAELYGLVGEPETASQAEFYAEPETVEEPSEEEPEEKEQKPAANKARRGLRNK
jgi:hypothetical protein